MTQILTPFADALRDRRERLRTARLAKRMCWTCQQDKPLKGGKFPEQRDGKGSAPDTRFRCADCEDKRQARIAAKTA